MEEGRWEGPLLLFSAAAAAVWLPRAYVNNSRERNNASIIILPLTARLCADRVILLRERGDESHTKQSRRRRRRRFCSCT